MTLKINSFAHPGESLTSELDYWTITTSIDIRPTGITVPKDIINPDDVWPLDVKGTFYTEQQYDDALLTQSNFDALIRGISYRAQPVIISQVGTNDDEDEFTVKFAIEHEFQWDTLSATSTQPRHSILTVLDGVNGFVYKGETWNGSEWVPDVQNNIEAYKHELL